MIDEAREETFPASDTASFVGAGAGPDKSLATRSLTPTRDTSATAQAGATREQKILLCIADLG